MYLKEEVKCSVIVNKINPAISPTRQQMIIFFFLLFFFSFHPSIAELLRRRISTLTAKFNCSLKSNSFFAN